MESYPENGFSLTGLRFESLVTYYGIYSSSHRGKCKLENREKRVEKIVVEAVPVSYAARQPSNWAKWIMRGTCRWNRKFFPIWKRQLKERLFQPLEPQLSGLWSISPSRSCFWREPIRVHRWEQQPESTYFSCRLCSKKGSLTCHRPKGFGRCRLWSGWENQL